MVAFARIDDNLVIYATTGGPRYSTTVAATKAGYERRNCDWAFPLGRWDIGDRQVILDDLGELLNFFHSRKGKFEAFRFKDFADYRVDMGSCALKDLGNGSYQLYKTYGGTLRRITKPVPNTVSVLDSQGTALDCAIDYNTGIVSNLSGTPAAWEGEFDVPVRFDTDEFKHRFDHFDRETKRGVFYVATIPVVEVLE